MIDEGISVPVPPPNHLPPGLWKRLRPRPKPLQERILRYLNEGRKASINAVSEDLEVSRFSTRRSLAAMESGGFVKDQMELFAASIVPKIKSHSFTITNAGQGELRYLKSIEQAITPSPLGYRILLFLMHGHPATIGQIAKATSSLEGHVRRVMKSLHNARLVDCLYSKTRTSFGHDMITHLYKISESGREVLDAGPAAHLRMVRRPVRDMKRVSTSVL
jgi:predicted ArsR family transcriptional regulator